MARHKVNFSVPPRPLRYRDVEFEVYRDGEFFGWLGISQGALEWKPAHGKRRVKRVTWEKFDDLMRQNGREVKY